jgi:hypothetical protein
MPVFWDVPSTAALYMDPSSLVTVPVIRVQTRLYIRPSVGDAISRPSMSAQGHQQSAGSLAPGRLLPSALQPINETHLHHLSAAKSRHTARSFLMEIDQSAGICKVHSCLSVLDVIKRPPSSACPRRQTHCRDSCHMGGRSFALYILLTSIGTRRDRRHVARLKHSRDGIHPRAILV